MKKSFIIVFASVSSLFAQTTFTLKSKDLEGQFTNTGVFNGFGCTGENKSPSLNWVNAPAGTKSFAVTMFDPDAPTGSGWWHWLVFDIPSTISGFNAALSADMFVQSKTDFGGNGYGGPCPPQGDKPHTYIITVFALKTEKLGLDKNATPAVVGYYLGQNMIAKASIVAYHKR
ncbi:MAG: YbhB/YbcL family Raf kinase inhibitor-like protein [Bacteroidetes bacterium]|nr:MAG: YbhB/YbcL family Raf kinase inhibitor-like protein [Bacteroidota bacterium]